MPNLINYSSIREIFLKDVDKRNLKTKNYSNKLVV